MVSKNFNDPRVTSDKWSLEVSGLVAQPRQFSYEEILALPTVTQHTTLECISNTLGGKLMSNAFWTGVPLSQLLGSVGPQPAAQAVIFRSADNYYESFPLDVAMAPDVLLAHMMNGAALPDKHGFPLRLILPGRYGMKNPKWIIKIELVAERIDGYWVRRGSSRSPSCRGVVCQVWSAAPIASGRSRRCPTAGVSRLTASAFESPPRGMPNAATPGAILSHIATSKKAIATTRQAATPASGTPSHAARWTCVRSHSREVTVHVHATNLWVSVDQCLAPRSDVRPSAACGRPGYARCA